MINYIYICAVVRLSYAGARLHLRWNRHRLRWFMSFNLFIFLYLSFIFQR